MLLILALSLTACNSSRKMNLSEESRINLEERAFQKYGSKYLLIANKTKSHTLVINKTKQFKEFGFDINFFIFDNRRQINILEDFLKSGHVEWISDFEIKAINKKVDESNDRKRLKEEYVYDVITNKKTQL